MGKTVRIGGLAVLVGVCVGLTSSNARADYLMTLVDSSTGLSSVDVLPGANTSVDLILTSDAGDVHDSNGFFVTASRGDLLLNSWAWSSTEFNTGSPDDFTVMSGQPGSGGALLAALPLPINNDVNFAALTHTSGVTFGTGTLISFELGVPASFAVPQTITLNVIPDQFFDSNTFMFPVGIAGAPFDLNVTPEPATLMLLGLGGLAVMRRRRLA